MDIQNTIHHSTMCELENTAAINKVNKKASVKEVEKAHKKITKPPK